MRVSIRPQMWAAVRKLAKAGQPIDAPAVRDLLNGAPTHCLPRIRDYLRALTAGGYLEGLPITEAGRGVYRLVHDCGAAAPRLRADGTAVVIGMGRERLWNVMRVLRSGFTALDLAVHCSVDDHVIAEDAARDYCQRLARCGYLRTLEPGRWQLVRSRWCGPTPPRVGADKSVYDPNTDTTYSPTGEVCDD